MTAMHIKHCPTCGKWTESSIPMAPGTQCTCLTKPQQAAVQVLREATVCQIIDAIEAFYKEYPELRVHFNFTLDATPVVGRD